MTARAAVVAAVLALAGAARGARAQEDEDDVVVTKRVGFAERAGTLTCTTSISEIFDPHSYDQLASGLASRIAVRIYLYRRQATERPVAISVMQNEVVYDLWDEVYVVRTRGPQGERQMRFRSREAAVRAMTAVDHVPIAPLDAVAIGPHYFVAMVVELNPVSPELAAEMRRWLSRPAGETLDASSSFFGSFVSVFVNPKLGRADRVLRVRSQPFYRTPR